MSKQWTIKFLEKALDDLKKIDVKARRRIVNTMENILKDGRNPRSLGKPLKGKLCTFWRYRIGSYRVLCTLSDRELTVLVIRVAHRGTIYD